MEDALDHDSNSCMCGSNGECNCQECDCDDEMKLQCGCGNWQNCLINNQEGEYQTMLIRIFTLGLQFAMLNAGQSKSGKMILKEGMDVVSTLGAALKDKKITQAEVKAVSKELKQFNKAATDLLDSLVIPE